MPIRLCCHSTFYYSIKKQLGYYSKISLPYLYYQLSSYTLAGTRRFYENVDITCVPAPWLTQRSFDTFDNEINDTIESKRMTNNSIKSSLQPPFYFSIPWYGITLDHHPQPLQTPQGKTLAVPSKTLAVCIANEWNQIPHLIQPTQLPLSTLVCTALDLTTDKTQLANIQNTILSYFSHDTTCFWAHEHDDRLLYRQEKKYWTPIHDWLTMSSEYSLNTLHSTCIQSPLAGHKLGHSQDGRYIATHTIRKSSTRLPHPYSTVQAVKSYIHSLDGWSLVALQSLTITLKSVLLAMTIVHGIHQQTHWSHNFESSINIMNDSNKEIKIIPYYDNVQDVIMASRLEEETQIEHWGLVEGGHDYDRLNCNISVRAACVLLGSIWGNV